MTPATATLSVRVVDGGFDLEIDGPLDGVVHIANEVLDDAFLRRDLLDEVLGAVNATQIERLLHVTAYRIDAPVPKFTRYRP